MDAGLASSDSGVIHGGQIVQNDGSRMDELDGAGRFEADLKSVFAKNQTRRNGSHGPPAVASTQDAVTGGSADFGFRMIGKRRIQMLFDRPSDSGFEFVES